MPAYGELHDHEFKQQVGDYELWVARVQYPNRPKQYAYNLRMGGSMSNDAPFNSEEEAIAKGIEQGQILTRKNQEEFDAVLSLQRSLQQAKDGERLPISQMRDGVEAEGGND